MKAKHTVRPRTDAVVNTWLRYTLGFSVTACVGLAPYLGRTRIPLFAPLLSIIPTSIQDLAIPISSASIGLVAVLVQWFSVDISAGLAALRWFALLVCVELLLLGVFVVLESYAVVHIYVRAMDMTVSYAVGFSEPSNYPCTGLDKATCVATKIGLDPREIKSYFGEARVSTIEMILVVIYVAVTSLFAFLVGLLVIKQRLIHNSSVD